MALGRFDIDPNVTGVGKFGLDATGKFKTCSTCCTPVSVCGLCSTAQSNYNLTFSGITLCSGWSGTVNGTYNLPFDVDNGASCTWRLRTALTLTGPVGVRTYDILFIVKPTNQINVGIVDQFFGFFSTHYNPFTASDKTGLWVPVNGSWSTALSCDGLGETFAAGTYVCNDKLNSSGLPTYKANGTGGTVTIA